MTVPLQDTEFSAGSLIMLSLLVATTSPMISITQLAHTLVKAKQLKGQISKQLASTINRMYTQQ